MDRKSETPDAFQRAHDSDNRSSAPAPIEAALRDEANTEFVELVDGPAAAVTA